MRSIQSRRGITTGRWNMGIKRRTLNGNLGAYHFQNKLMDMRMAEFSRRLSAAATPAERKQVMDESQQYFNEQDRVYKQLGEELVHITSKHWWEFWK